MRIDDLGIPNALADEFISASYNEIYEERCSYRKIRRTALNVSIHFIEDVCTGDMYIDIVAHARYLGYNGLQDFFKSNPSMIDSVLDGINKGVLVIIED